jgi:hypothetical protein
MLDFANIVQNVSTVFFFFLHKATERLMSTAGLHRKLTTNCYLYVLLVGHLASLPSVGEKFARGVSRTVTPRYGTPEMQKFIMKQRYTENE